MASSATGGPRPRRRPRPRDSAAPGRGRPRAAHPGAPLGALVRGIFHLRLVAVCLTALWLPQASGGQWLPASALMAAAAASAAPVAAWRWLARPLLRHPGMLAADGLLCALVLAVAGPQSPFLIVTLGTAALAGVLYRWAGATLFTVLLVGAYGWAVWLWLPLLPVAANFQALVGTPALYALAAASGAGTRRLLERQAATEAALTAATRAAAASEERLRLARELHDSLGKTLHGMELLAAGLLCHIERDPARARQLAATIARSARTAATEARKLLADLRADRPRDALSTHDPHQALSTHDPRQALGAVLLERVAAWAAQHRLGLHCRVGERVDCADPAARHELLRVVDEALRNVARHAQASRVELTATALGAELVVTVRDDGCGFAAPEDPATLTRAGHFGIAGMAERLASVGGGLRLDSRPGAGTSVRATVPRLRDPSLLTPAASARGGS